MSRLIEEVDAECAVQLIRFAIFKEVSLKRFRISLEHTASFEAFHSRQTSYSGSRETQEEEEKQGC